MQGQRSIFDPFPETVDLNQGSNSNTMDESDDWDNMLSPMERRLLNNDLSNELNFTCVNTPVNHNYHSFSSWDVGESSSQASLQEPVSNNNWPPSFGAHNSRIEEQLESSIHPRDSFAIGPSSMQNTVSNNIPRNVNLNIGYSGSNSDDDGPGFMDLYKSGRPETGPEHGPDPSLGHWGLSCKRKALDGTSGPSSSSCFPQHEHVVRPVSSGLVNPVPEPLNTRIPESSQTQYGSRDSIPYNNNISSTGNPTRRPIFANRPISLNEFLDRTVSISANSSNHSNPQPPLMHVPSVPRNTHPFPWGNNIGSRGGSSSSSVQPERGSESTFRSLLRNNMQYHNFVPSSDPTNWSLATGNSSTNGGGASSSSRNGLGSGSGSGPGHFNGVWRPQHGPTVQSQQRLSELPAWTLFPSADLESGGQRGNFPPFPAGSSSTLEDNHVSSGVHRQRRHHHQPFSRAGLLMEVPGDDWRVLAADIEGRQRLVSEIRQVLNAMRRGENLRAEDYMLFDPFINGVAELHDRHRDMRLDVDNMSYEELLALEERIGNVNTGLSEEVILKLMKQRKHIAFMAISTQHLEPCCICQEQYETGDDIGRLDCGHDFHRDCIKQWLAQKNICPICKMTGLAAT